MTHLELIEQQCGLEMRELYLSLEGSLTDHADVVVFLQGDRLDRAQKVEELYRAEVAPIVLITGNNAMMECRAANDEHDLYLRELVSYLETTAVPSDHIVVDDTAMNTSDQAVNTVKLARERGWRTLVLVTSPYHMLRTFLTFVKQAQEQAWHGTISFALAEQAWDDRPSGRKLTAVEMLASELEKIKKYHNDIAPVNEGLAFIG